MSSREWFRYRTCVLVGPWRRRAEKALKDALDARQAEIDPAGGLSWNVRGTIERSECQSDGAPCRGNYPRE